MFRKITCKIKAMELNKNVIEDNLRHALEEIQRKQEELDKKEKYLMANMLKEDKENRFLMGVLLEEAARRTFMEKCWVAG